MGDPTVPRPLGSPGAAVTPEMTSAVRRPRSIGRWQMSVPNHSSEPRILPRAARHIVVGFDGLDGKFGGEARVRAAVASLAASAPSGGAFSVETLHLPCADAASLDVVRKLVDEALVGSAVAFVGAEREVFAARSVALAAGAEPSEVLTVSLDTETDSDDDVVWSASPQARDLFCAHCHTLFEAIASIGDAVTCPQCGLLLAVHYNFSRRRSAYMARHLPTVDLGNRGSQP
jgi:hypothetical protein